jgi:lipid-binding SYLF domain-containing protein
MESDMRKLLMAFIVVFASLTGAQALAAEPATDKDKARAEIDQTAQTVLSTLFKAKPAAMEAMPKAAGFAVFSNYGLTILYLGGGAGKGVAVNNKTKQHTYMRMVEAKAGLGLGVKKSQVVFIFETEEALKRFVDKGWEFGGQVTGAAKTAEMGGAFQDAFRVGEGVLMYQLTDAGLTAELTLTGTKYFKDDELN